jgi:hypothetical protein
VLRGDLLIYESEAAARAAATPLHTINCSNLTIGRPKVRAALGDSNRDEVRR